MPERPPSFENEPPPEGMKIPTPEPLLAESWNRKHADEVGEEDEFRAEPKGRDEEAYEAIASQLASFPEGREKETIKKLFDQLKTDVAGYIRAMAVLQKNKLSGEQAMIKHADTRRSQAHTRVIDDLNILSRAMAAAGLDNSWRSDIGLSRKDATRWAWKIAKTLISEETADTEV